MTQRQIDWLRKAFEIETDSCIEWPHYKTPKGYGRVDLDGKPVRVHRLVCIWAHGEPSSDGLFAAHNCNNPSCINKRHLRWATPKQNTKDRIENGTYFYGTANPKSKLSEEQVLYVRKMAGIKTGKRLSIELGVSTTSISKIIRRKHWRHI